jgi:hypothetical protein
VRCRPKVHSSNCPPGPERSRGRCYVHLELQKCLQIAKSGPQETRNLRLLRRSADFCVVLRLRLCYSPFPDSHTRGGVSLSNGEVLFEPSRDG